MDGGSFAGGSDLWLERLGNLRNVVRQELVRRQLLTALPAPGGRVLDVGAGQGTQAIALARLGLVVDALEPDERMRDACGDALGGEQADVAARVSIVAGELADLASLPALEAGYDLVLCHGVLMYLGSPEPAMSSLAGKVAPGGALSLVARNAQAMAWRPALRADWAGALAMLSELESARREDRDAVYRNEIGVEARADDVEAVSALLASCGLTEQEWFGVRVATDGVPVDTPVPADRRELAMLLDAEEALGRTDPYRRLGTLFHLIARRR